MERFVVTAVALASLLGSGNAVVVRYLCSMDGELRSSCCCPSKSGSVQVHRGARLERAECCDTFTEQHEALLGTHESSRLAASAPALARLTPSVDLAAPVARAPTQHVNARGPPRAHAPPIFIRNCRFLI